jgi:DNA-3-methyladenine glycosylase I
MSPTNRRVAGAPDGRPRCPFPIAKPFWLAYHDEEWGTPVHDDRVLFEFLILEGAQAGLSWDTILRKREAYRAAFAGFDPVAVSKFDARRRKALMKDPGIVRNQLKIESAVTNATAFLALRKEFGSFDRYLWGFIDGMPIQNRRRSMQEIPATTSESDSLSKDLKKRGFRFVGSTIIYAYMQAVGMVNDHLVTCFRHDELRGAARRASSRRR